MLKNKVLKLSLFGCYLAGSFMASAAVSRSFAQTMPAHITNSKVPETDSQTKNSAVTLRYAVFVHGLHVLDAEGAYVLKPWGYGGNAHLKTVGLASWFLQLNISAQVEGRFDGTMAVPLDYKAHGLSRKKERSVHIKFDDSGPHIVSLEPKDKERDPLPEAELKHSIDMLSGLATLFQSLAVTGKCDLSGTLYDGLRLTHIEAHGPFADKVPDSHGSYYSGKEAQRCDFEGHQIAGFVKTSHHKDLLRRPQPGKAWFLTLKDYGIVPVKIEFHHPKIGNVEMVMQSVPSSAKMDVPGKKGQMTSPSEKPQTKP
ncbi:DUF3108 domain-containing protein [Aristophania vespae]|uniref:DUF3108 domain-containing protein n=1 Tax=Aristophania vespae TaxID=2697033 RepID=UPI00235189B5|nr:DUF3108 domain-containing protein [Aristophania vespae]UMM63240.1 hypothetical protein DM15PD_01980 [Aristophania vespae]